MSPLPSPGDAPRPGMNPRVAPSIPSIRTRAYQDIHAPAGEPGSSPGGAGMLDEMWSAMLWLAALRALAAAGCLEQLRGGPLTTADLAGRCGVHEPSLARLLRGAAQTGMLRAGGQGRYELTEAGQALVTGPGAARLQRLADPEMWNSFGELSETLRTGQPPVVSRYGSTYAYLAGHTAEAAAFDRLMTALYDAVADRLATNAAIPAEGTVVDVGGGRGTFTAAILRARPGLRAILLDQERPAAAATKYLADSGVADRCEVVTGDFFDAVPAGADCYLLAHVIHNWDDPRAAAILRVVRAAMSRRARLLIVEQLVPSGDSPSFAKDLDITLLATGLGLERSLPEYSALLDAAGFRQEQVTELAQGEYMIPAAPAALPG